MILAINTSQREHEMAIIDGDKILLERIWTDEKDDVDRLVPTLEDMLEELAIEKDDIKDIAVVNGPGPFTAVRVGISFANALAEGLKAELHQIDTFTLLREKAALKDPILVVLNAGGLDVGVSHEHEVKVGPMADLLAEHSHDSSIHVVFEGNETQGNELHSICLEKEWEEIPTRELQSMAEMILTSGLEVFGLVDLVEPYYLKSPKITKSSDPWKQP